MANRSNYPISLDTWIDRADVSPSDRTNILRYQELTIKANKTPEEITELASLVTTLGAKLHVADITNKIQDAILNIQTAIGLLDDLDDSLTKTSIVNAINSAILDFALKRTPAVLVTENKTIGASDESTTQNCVSASAITISINTNANVAIPIGFITILKRSGSGTVEVDEVEGVTLHSVDGKKSISKQYGRVALEKVGEDEWEMYGLLG